METWSGLAMFIKGSWVYPLSGFRFGGKKSHSCCAICVVRAELESRSLPGALRLFHTCLDTCHDTCVCLEGPRESKPHCALCIPPCLQRCLLHVRYCTIPTTRTLELSLSKAVVPSRVSPSHPSILDHLTFPYTFNRPKMDARQSHFLTSDNLLAAISALGIAAGGGGGFFLDGEFRGGSYHAFKLSPPAPASGAGVEALAVRVPVGMAEEAHKIDLPSQVGDARHPDAGRGYVSFLSPWAGHPCIVFVLQPEEAAVN